MAGRYWRTLALAAAASFVALALSALHSEERHRGASGTARAQGAGTIDCPAPLAGYQINDRPEFRGAVAVNPGNGTMLATCRYAQPVVIRPGPLQQAATYDLYISWAENEQAVRAICALKDGTFD
ncbi:MAG: hypothetical protein IT431_18255, partial [Phycisphaerales bacterium]|nr:hypothetical protein [Phycisphaerales bacterium]